MHPLQIEARTGKDIELKQHQLRQLVGNSYRCACTSAQRPRCQDVSCFIQLKMCMKYLMPLLIALLNACRDLIGSADTIVAIARNCEGILGDVSDIQVSCSAAG